MISKIVVGLLTGIMYAVCFIVAIPLLLLIVVVCLAVFVAMLPIYAVIHLVVLIAMKKSMYQILAGKLRESGSSS